MNAFLKVYWTVGVALVAVALATAIIFVLKCFGRGNY